jgi:hypothetical protein
MRRCPVWRDTYREKLGHMLVFLAKRFTRFLYLGYGAILQDGVIDRLLTIAFMFVHPISRRVQIAFAPSSEYAIEELPGRSQSPVLPHYGVRFIRHAQVAVAIA